MFADLELLDFRAAGSRRHFRSRKLFAEVGVGDERQRTSGVVGNTASMGCVSLALNGIDERGMDIQLSIHAARSLSRFVGDRLVGEAVLLLSLDAVRVDLNSSKPKAGSSALCFDPVSAYGSDCRETVVMLQLAGRVVGQLCVRCTLRNMPKAPLTPPASLGAKVDPALVDGTESLGSPEECAICFETITEKAKLHCKCNVSFCATCWKRALAASSRDCGVARCPTCRCASAASIGKLIGTCHRSRPTQVRLLSEYAETQRSPPSDTLSGPPCACGGSLVRVSTDDRMSETRSDSLVCSLCDGHIRAPTVWTCRNSGCARFDAIMALAPPPSFDACEQCFLLHTGTTHH